MWLDVAPELASDRRAVLIDLPAHGGSGHPPGRYPPRRLARAVLGALDDAGLERAVLVGNSIGGAAALAVYEAAPHRVAGLILLGAPGGVAIPDVLRELADSAVSPGALATISPEVLGLLWWAVSGADTPAVRRLCDRAVAERTRDDWPSRARARASALHEVIRFEPALESIAVPALVVQGEDDRVVWPRAGRAMASRIPAAEWALLEGCGHFPQAECPSQLTARIQAFLRARIDAPGQRSPR